MLAGNNSCLAASHITFVDFLVKSSKLMKFREVFPALSTRVNLLDAILVVAPDWCRSKQKLLEICLEEQMFHFGLGNRALGDSFMNSNEIYSSPNTFRPGARENVISEQFPSKLNQFRWLCSSSLINFSLKLETLTRSHQQALQLDINYFTKWLIWLKCRLRRQQCEHNASTLLHL